MTTCIVPGCPRHPTHARRLCRPHYYEWYLGRDLGVRVPEAYEDNEGPGVCLCPISYPKPKCCIVCGFPCVHRMAPHIRALALQKMPGLARQVIDRGNSRSVA